MSLPDVLQLVVPVQVHAPVFEANLQRKATGMSVGTLYRADASPTDPLCRVQDLDRHTQSGFF